MIAVVKVGSSSVTTETVRRLCGELAAARAAGHTVVVVTSGAIAAGWDALDRGEQRPSDPAVLQAVSAVGQHRLMRMWQDGFEPHGVLAGQVLLAPLDFVHRTQYLHARGTLHHLADLGVVPVVNENDAVADEEIRFGDNDRLAALVAHLVGAQLLRPADRRARACSRPTRGATPRRRSSRRWSRSTTSSSAWPAGPGSAVGSGGMASKLAAAKIATWSGVQTVIADAGPPRGAGGGPGRRARRGDGVPGPAEPALGPQAVDRLRAGIERQPHRRRRRPVGADRRRSFAAGGGGHRGRRAPSGPTMRSRSPGPTAWSSPRAWSGCTRRRPRSGWGGAARSSSIATTWCL